MENALNSSLEKISNEFDIHRAVRDYKDIDLHGWLMEFANLQKKILQASSIVQRVKDEDAFAVRNLTNGCINESLPLPNKLFFIFVIILIDARGV